MNILQQNSRRNHTKFKLFIDLKTTVECILSKNSTNIWNIHGGFSSLIICLESILHHGFKPISTKCVFTDYWAFVKNLEWLDLTPTTFSYKSVNKTLSSVISVPKEEVLRHKTGRMWLEHNLRELTLYRRFQALLSNKQLVAEYYEDWSFLLDTRYLAAFFTCLRALEANDSTILTNLSTEMFRSEILEQEPVSSKKSLQRIQEKKDCIESRTTSSSFNSNLDLILNYNQFEKKKVKSEIDSNTSVSPLFDDLSENEDIDDFISIQTQLNDPKLIASSGGENKGLLPDLVASAEEAISVTSAVTSNPYQKMNKFHHEGLKLYSDVDEMSNQSDSRINTNDEYENSFINPSTAQLDFGSSTSQLVSFLRNQDLATCADIDKENAHFSIADLMIATLEQLKYTQQMKLRDRKDQITNEELVKEAPSTSACSENSDLISTSLYMSAPSSVSSVSINYSDNSNLKGSSSQVSVEDEQVPRRETLDSLSHSRQPSATAEMIAIGLLETVSANQNVSAEQLKFLVSEDEAPQKVC